MAMVGAAEYAMASRGSRDGAPALDDIGRPSEVALRALEHLASAESATPSVDTGNDPWWDEPRRSTP
jgi:hypothetical protein